MRLAIWLLLALCGAALQGCSSSSSSGEVFTVEGGHPDDWENPAFLGSGDFHGSSVTVSYGPDGAAGLYAQRCAGCHGVDGSGGVGSDIRGKTSGEINGAMGAVVYMQWIGKVLSADDVSTIAGFLSAPASSSAINYSADVCAGCHGSDFNGGIASVGCYSCHAGPTGSVGHPSEWLSGKSTPGRYHGYYAERYEVACTACHGPDLRGPAVPSCYSCHGACGGGNCAPVANAGIDQTVSTGALVSLDGTASSDVNGDTLAFSWVLLSVPAGSSASLSAPYSSQPTFTADVAGTYEIGLSVSDGKAASETDTVRVLVSTSGTISFAAGIQPIFDGNCITCHSSGGLASFLPLTSDVSYSSLLNQPSQRTGTSGIRVIPFDSAGSVLYQRVSGIGLAAGESTMPLGLPMLSASDQELIRNWIDGGAAP